MQVNGKSKVLILLYIHFQQLSLLIEIAIEECAEQYDLIVTVEEHNIIGGFGSAVSEVLAELTGPKARILKIGLMINILVL
jgi:transketolase C-terminal domain/subunit